MTFLRTAAVVTQSDGKAFPSIYLVNFLQSDSLYQSANFFEARLWGVCEP